MRVFSKQEWGSLIDTQIAKVRERKSEAIVGSIEIPLTNP